MKNVFNCSLSLQGCLAGTWHICWPINLNHESKAVGCRAQPHQFSIIFSNDASDYQLIQSPESTHVCFLINTQFILSGEMAAPGFGFSFGDFVSTIKIVKDICRALRDTGGAKDEFQHVLIDLQHLGILLEQLNHGVWDHGGDAGHLNAIKGMALTCKTPLQEFLDKMEKYKSLQGTSIKGFKARLGSEARKVQWAIGMKEEVEKFRTVVIAKMVSINLLIQLHTL
jgi:hypothetical protein